MILLSIRLLLPKSRERFFGISSTLVRVPALLVPEG
jgi:hypothetical protein